jgi:alkylation response protein AidB-like acyl-CoA dehydrogenase
MVGESGTALGDELRRALRGAFEDGHAGDRRLRQLGPLAAGVPEPLGGGGAPTLPLLVVEECARHLAAPAWIRSGVLATRTLSGLASGSSGARAALGRVLGDAVVSAVCWPGPFASGIRLQHTAGAVTGPLPVVVGGGNAEWLLLVESAPDGTAEVGLVDLADVSRRPVDGLDPTRPLAEVRLDATPVRGLGRLDLSEARGLRAFWLLVIAADCLGSMAAGLDLAVAHARERTAFGRPIGAFQAVRHRLADVYVDVETVRAAVIEGGAAWAEGAEDALVVALAAASHALDAVVRVAEAVVLVHGAMGFTREGRAQSLLRRAYGIQALAPRARELRIELATS